MTTAKFLIADLPHSAQSAVGTRRGLESLRDAIAKRDAWAISISVDDAFIVLSINADPDLPRRLAKMDDDEFASLLAANIARTAW